MGIHFEIYRSSTEKKKGHKKWVSAKDIAKTAGMFSHAEGPGGGEGEAKKNLER